MKESEQLELINTVKGFPKRDGEKPIITGPVPHVQQNQYPRNDEFASLLHTYILTFNGVGIGLSHIGDGGLRAYFIISEKAKVGFTERFLIDNEFAHIHRHPSHSLHVALPYEVGKDLEIKNWVENHPLSIAEKIPKTNFMLFGPRNKEELEKAKQICRVSYLFAAGIWNG